MIKKNELILHIGLPKTATTTLQNNLFFPLHKEGKINFLGRYQSGKSNDYFNPFEDIYTGIKDKNSDLDTLKKKLASLMCDDKLNVISEESLAITENEIFEVILKNLSFILEGFQTTLLLSIRNPVEFIRSYYIEQYRWFYKNNEIDTINKYFEEITKNGNHPKYDMYFFERYLDLIRNYFPNTKVIFFEDIKYDKDYYTSEIAKTLKLEASSIKHRLFESIENKTLANNTSESITLSQILLRNKQAIEKIFDISFLRKTTILKYLFRFIIRLSSRVVIKPQTRHNLNSKETEKKLNKKVLLNDPYKFAQDNNLDIEKLFAYHYTAPTANPADP